MGMFSEIHAESTAQAIADKTYKEYKEEKGDYYKKKLKQAA